MYHYLHSSFISVDLCHGSDMKGIQGEQGPQGEPGAGDGGPLTNLFSGSGNNADVVEIPRVDPSGVFSSPIVLTDTGVLTSFSVSVDITHPEVGALTVKLVSPSGDEFTLRQGTLPSSEVSSGVNLVGTYPTDLTSVDSFDPLIGTAVAGTWRLFLSDSDLYPRNGAVRQLNSWSIQYERESPDSWRLDSDSK